MVHTFLRQIYFSAFGSGLGHAARVWQISQRLVRDADAFICSSFDEGLDFLKSHQMKAFLSPSIDLKWSSEGGFSTRDSFVSFPKIIFTFMGQFEFESNLMERYKPDVVVSDSRATPILAARARHIPVITLLNQFKVLFPTRFRNKVLSGCYERFAGNMLGLFWSLSDRVLLPDLPPPYTISEANVNGTNFSNVARFVGFMSPKIRTEDREIQKLKRILEFDSKEVVFIQVSGPNATKRRFIECALEVARQISNRSHVVVSLGFPAGSTEPKKLSGGSWLYEWCPVKDPLFALSRTIVARAGHGTIGQCINSGTPAVLVPILNHSEQLANSEKYEKLGLGLKLRSENLSPGMLEKSIDLCLGDPEYRERALDVKEISDHYDGIDGVCEVVRSYL
jgi:UDP-N-acetylglucosamine--N-acetylmuramyl-(pentapeptide) pyrophosphoryl-undecaprenol N-acetylglucosamine transferase